MRSIVELRQNSSRNDHASGYSNFENYIKTTDVNTEVKAKQKLAVKFSESSNSPKQSTLRVSRRKPSVYEKENYKDLTWNILYHIYARHCIPTAHTDCIQTCCAKHTAILPSVHILHVITVKQLTENWTRTTEIFTSLPKYPCKIPKERRTFQIRNAWQVDCLGGVVWCMVMVEGRGVGGGRAFDTRSLSRDCRIM